MEFDEDVWSDLHALEKLYGLLQIKPGNTSQKADGSQNLDEKAKLVLKRLLDGATRQAFQSHSKILEERSAASSMNNGTKPRAGTSRDSSQFNISNSYQDLNSHQSTSQSKKRCRNCGKHNKKIMNSAKEKKTLIEEVPSKDQKNGYDRDGDCHLHRRYFNHEKAKEFDHSKEAMQKRSHEIRRNENVGEPGCMGSQANWFKSEPGYNLLDHRDEKKKKPEKMVNVADAVWRFEARIRGDDQIPTKDRNAFGSKPQSSRLNRFLELKDEKSGPTVSNFVVSQNRKPVGVIEEENELRMSSHQEEKKQLEKTVDVAEAIQRLEARIRTNQQMSTQRVVDSVKDRHPISTAHQSKVMKNESPQKSGLTESKFLSSQNSKPVGVLGEENELLWSQMASQTDQKLKNTNVSSQITCQNCKKSKGTMVTDQMLNRTRKPVSYVDHLPSQKDWKPVSKSGKSVVEGNELPSHKPSLTSKPVCRSNSPSQKNAKRKDSTLPRQVLTQTNTKNQTLQRTFRPPVPSRTVGPNVSKEDLVGPRRPRERDLPRQKIVFPTLLDYKPSQMKVGPNQDRFKYGSEISGTHKNAQQLVPLKKGLPHQQRSKTSTVSSSSSYSYTGSSTTQDTSSCSESNDSEWDPPPDRMLTHHHDGGRTSQNRSPRVGRSSREDYPRRMTSYYSKAGPPHHTVGPTTISKSGDNERKIGRFRRFKDKLAFIFHHHHHHHHHHRDDDSDVSEEDDDGPDHGDRPFWKHVGNILHYRRSKEPNTMKYVRKSTARNMPRQRQQGHFHTLVGGLLRHLWGSKKSKPSTADIRRLERTLSGKKKITVKKWHWWQKFHKRGVSNSVKPRVKIGFRTKRPQLRGPKLN